MITNEIMFYVFLFKKIHYTFEQVDSFEYGTAFMLYNEDEENVKYYEFETKELADRFVSLKSISKEYYYKIL
jgi:hypothetical protein